MTASILVVGDANPDLVLRGDVVPRFGQAEQLLDSAGLVLGSSAGIAASGLAALGVPTSLVAVIGDDDFGRFTRSALVANGVDDAELIVDPALPTGLSVILSSPGDRSILTLPGAIPALTAAAVRAAVERVHPAHVHVASYFLQPALANELPALLSWLRSLGITTSLDTNWDPSGRWAGLAEVLPHVDYLFPNLEELAAIAAALGSAGPDAAAHVAAFGPSIVVKAGRDGGWSRTPHGTVTTAPGLVLDVVDTTGAGDSFDAGYLAAMLDGVTDEAVRLRWAAVAGSLSTRAAGGTGSQPSRAELLEHL
ncbi:sugar kinase [soil metagenome]